MKNRSRGITLVALVISIIILLILATISIQTLTHTGLFESANKAKLETKRSQITEWLELKLLEEQMNNPFRTSEDIIKATRESVTNNQEELKKMSEKVVIGETSTKENGEDVEIYFYVQVDKDIYKVSMEGSKFIGEEGKLPPVTKIENYIINTGETYETLAQAIENANEGDQIKVINDNTDISDVTINKNLIIDTNGKTLTRTKTINITSGIIVEITGEGTLTTIEEINLIENKGTLNITHRRNNKKCKCWKCKSNKK